MRKFLSLAVMCSLALPAMAFAQDEEVAAEAEVMVEEPAEEPTPRAIDEMPEAPKVAADDEPAEAEDAHPMLDGLTWMAMASAYYRIDGYTGAGVLAGSSYNSLGYPYTQFNGFGLNFVGGMVQYTGEKFGVTVDLRFGPADGGTGANLLTPIVPVKQGYVSWLPSDKVSIDFGFFDTIFGGEVADEWQNANFTRGALYFLRQPFNHMGVRSAFAFTDTFGFTLMLTNGGVLGGSPIDNNETPTIGWQFAIGTDAVGFYFGGQHGAANDNDNKNWENFFDWVLSASAGIFTLVANGDYQLSPTAVTGAPSGAFAYGHSLQLIFDASDKFSIGLRGEHLSGDEDFRNFASGGDTGLVTATLTLRYKPVEYLVLSLEGRGEWNTREIYFQRNGPTVTDPDTLEEILVPNQKKNYSAILGFTAFIGN